ncbi:MAG: 16S rRNA (guanine(966)-N(2))-methyltransferase RsmD [Paracoccaceae bacterium]
MRIIGGNLRGLRLAEVGKGDRAAHLRPTSDRVRESIFNLLQNGGYGNPVQGACVLDLFAGTGALGLEALSRGAAHAVLVDQGMVAQKLIGRNIELCRAGARARFVRRDAMQLGDAPDDPHDLVFLDPPYGQGAGETALRAALAGGWIAPDALIVWEENADCAPPEGFVRLDARRYGGTWVHVLSVDPQ